MINLKNGVSNESYVTEKITEIDNFGSHSRLQKQLVGLTPDVWWGWKHLGITEVKLKNREVTEKTLN